MRFKIVYSIAKEKKPKKETSCRHTREKRWIKRG